MAKMYRQNILFELVKDTNGDMRPMPIPQVEVIDYDSQRFENLLDLLTALADLLGDIQVYCGSEMVKFGLPIDDVLFIIMQSNFSKMGADGNPIYDERGKLQKGPHYWKPEPKIRELLRSMLTPTPTPTQS
jgi:predicted HAD superfamily Cof-like phosphohydrolase